MSYFPNVDPIYLYRRAGTEQDPYIELEDINYVFNGAIILKEIPSFVEGIEVFDEESNQLTEAESVENIGVNEYKPDYSTGLILFNNSLEGVRFTIRYWGTGYVNLPSTRIFVPNSSEDPMMTLQNILDNVEEGTAVIETVKNIEFKGDFDPNHQYSKWNFVSFSGKTFVAMSNIQGLSPSESSNWKLVSSGVGFVGVYDSENTYTVGDMVADEDSKNIYFSKIVDNTYPLTDEGSWDLMLTLDDLIEKVNNALEQLDEFQEVLEASDLDREQNEQDRQNSFDELMDDYESFHQLVLAEEEVRDANEIDRLSTEVDRVQMEDIRQSNESIRESNEESRVLAETVRDQAFTALLESVQTGVGESVDTIDEALEDFRDLKNSVEILVNQATDIDEQIDEKLLELSGFQTIDEFDIDATYQKYNIVSFEGSSYMAKQETQGNELDDDMFWFPVALRGLDNMSIEIDGVSPDQEGRINLDDLDIVRNETFDEFVSDMTESMGDISGLTTANSDNVVEAINELKRRLDNVVDLLNVGG